MSVNQTLPVTQNGENDTVTLIALPLQLFQESSQQPQTVIVQQNLLIKSFPDGTFVIDPDQLLTDNTSVPEVATVENEDNCIEKDTEKTEEDIIADDNSPAQISLITSKINTFPQKENHTKVQVRLLHSKPLQENRKNGRDKKDVSGHKTGDKKEPFKCTHCDKEFDKWILFKKHQKVHANEKKFLCEFCSASYGILSNYLLHLATHNKDDPTCPECGKKFQRIASLKAHLMYHEKDETFYCEECDLSFNNELEMNNHLEKHGTERKTSDSLQCKHCHQKFTTSSEFRKHMNEHSKIRNILHNPARKKPKKNSHNIDLKHTCKFCNKSFQKRSQIERHLRVHSGEKPYVCKICDRGFSQKGSLQIHMTKHTGIRPHKCALCPAKFSQKGNLRAHILKTHSIPHGGDNVFSCSECSCVFKRLGSLNCHMTRNHPKERNSDINMVMSQLATLQNSVSAGKDILQQAIIKSDLPESPVEEKRDDPSAATYVTLSDLGLDGVMRRYVIKQRRINDIRWHICSYCPKEFKKPSDLVRHVRVHTREKPFKCKLCFRSFAVKSTLTTHIKTHTNVKKLQCKICLKVFCSWASLNVHMRKHTGQKPHKCSICNKAFRTTSQLKQHFQVHLTNEKNISYVKDASSDLLLQEPMIITSKGLQPVNLNIQKRTIVDMKNRPYVCLTCGDSFRKMSHLKQHHFRHTGEKPFRCHLCFRSFTTSSILKNHFLTHNKLKAYKCPICDKNFGTNGSLKRHLESHNNNRPYLCPHCFKNFKSLMTCRKHMKLHKLENQIQLQAIKEAGFTASDLIQPKPSELPYTPDLTDTIDEDIPFPLIPTLSAENDLGNDKIFNAGDVPLVTEALQTDETNAVVIPVITKPNTVTEVENNIHDIEDTLNTQMLNIIGTENFVDANAYVNKINGSQPIATTDELVNTLTGTNPATKPIDDAQFLYQQVIVNLQPEPEQIPVFDNTGIENLLAQNESLLLTDINGININEANNVFLPFTMNSQQDFPQNQMIMMSNDVEEMIPASEVHPAVNLDALHAINGLLQNSENLHDTSIVLTNTAIQTNNEFLNAPEEDVAVAADSQLASAVNAIKDDLLNKTLSSSEPVPTILQTEVTPEQIDTTCSLCKLNFKTKNDLELHQCLNFVNVSVSTATVDPTPVENSTAAQYNIANTSVLTEQDFHEYVAEKVKNSTAKEKEDTEKPMYRNLCSYCPKSFRKASDLQRHLRTHTGERPYKCTECAKSFSLKSTLDSHSKVHKGKKEFACVVCNCLFTTKGSLSLHMRLHTGAKPFKCALCPLRFRTSGHRKAHLTVHYREALRTGKVPSEIITRKAKMSELLESTLQNIINSNLGKENEGKNVSGGVGNQSELVSGETREETVREQTVNSLENIMIDSDEPPLMQFEIETNENGQLINIKPTNSGVLLIDGAGRNPLSTQIELDEKTRVQIESLLSENGNSIDTKRIKAKKICPICDKEFSAKYLLDRHLKIHTGEKTYSCKQCPSMFNQKNALNIHMRTHLGTRPYRCQFCSNTFTQSGNLKTHIKRIHSLNEDELSFKQNNTKELQTTDTNELQNNRTVVNLPLAMTHNSSPH